MCFDLKIPLVSYDFDNFFWYQNTFLQFFQEKTHFVSFKSQNISFPFFERCPCRKPMRPMAAFFKQSPVKRIQNRRTLRGTFPINNIIGVSYHKNARAALKCTARTFYMQTPPRPPCGGMRRALRAGPCRAGRVRRSGPAASAFPLAEIARRSVQTLPAPAPPQNSTRAWHIRR